MKDIDPIIEILKELEELQRANVLLERRDARKADWGVPGETELYVRDLKRDKRRALLDLLCPGRKCFVCDRIKSRSRQWVVFEIARIEAFEVDVSAVIRSRARNCAKGGIVAICRSCVMRNLKGIMWDKD